VSASRPAAPSGGPRNWAAANRACACGKPARVTAEAGASPQRLARSRVRAARV